MTTSMTEFMQGLLVCVAVGAASIPVGLLYDWFYDGWREQGFIGYAKQWIAEQFLFMRESAPRVITVPAETLRHVFRQVCSDLSLIRGFFERVGGQLR